MCLINQILSPALLGQVTQIDPTTCFVGCWDQLDWSQIFSSFVVLLAVIDSLGAIPTIIKIKESSQKLSAWKAAVYSFAFMVIFYFGGLAILDLFDLDFQEFAAAGSLVIFFASMEILLDVTIFHEKTPTGHTTLVPLVFPLLAGAGSFTTLLTIGVAYSTINIIIGLLLNTIWIYVLVEWTSGVRRVLTDNGIYFIRKFFGIILLALSVKLFAENMAFLLHIN